MLYSNCHKQIHFQSQRNIPVLYDEQVGVRTSPQPTEQKSNLKLCNMGLQITGQP